MVRLDGIPLSVSDIRRKCQRGADDTCQQWTAADGATDESDWREMIDGIQARRGEHIPGAVASNGGASNEFTQYHLGAKSYADEGALIALAAMRDLTGLDYGRIIKAVIREAAYRPDEMPF